MALCINCHIHLRPDHQKNEYNAVDFSTDFVLIIEEWCGREISDNDRLCQECVNLVIQEANNRIDNPNGVSNRQLGHECVCISCGISLSKRTGRRRHRLPENSVERNYIKHQLSPRQIPIEAWACYACWMRSRRNARQPNPPQPVITTESADFDLLVDVHQLNESSLASTHPSSSVTIFPTSFETNSSADQMPNSQASIRKRDKFHLNNYTRTPDTPNHCFVPDCANTERLRVPRNIRKAILSQYKIYITQNARVCKEHSMLFNWNILTKYEFSSSFTTNHLENMLNLFCTTPAGPVLNFEDE